MRGWTWPPPSWLSTGRQAVNEPPDSCCDGGRGGPPSSHPPSLTLAPSRVLRATFTTLVRMVMDTPTARPEPGAPDAPLSLRSKSACSAPTCRRGRGVCGRREWAAVGAVGGTRAAPRASRELPGAALTDRTGVPAHTNTPSKSERHGVRDGGTPCGSSWGISPLPFLGLVASLCLCSLGGGPCSDSPLGPASVP